MQLDLTDEEAAALLSLLNRVIATIAIRCLHASGCCALFGRSCRVRRQNRRRDRRQPKNGRQGEHRAPVGRDVKQTCTALNDDDPDARLSDLCRPARHRRYRRSVPVTTISTSRPPHPEQTSRERQSRTGVSAPYRATISAGSGSSWWPHALHTRSAEPSRLPRCRVSSAGRTVIS